MELKEKKHLLKNAVNAMPKAQIGLLPQLSEKNSHPNV